MVAARAQLAQAGDGGIDPRPLVRIEQVAILCQRLFRSLDHALRLDLLFAQRAQHHVVAGVLDARFEHLRDLVVGQAIGWFHQHARLDAGRHFARGHRQQAIGIDLEGHTDARRARHHRRNAAQFEARQRTAVGNQFALALHDMEGHCRLAVLEGGELLRPRNRQRGIARHDLLHQPAHGLQTERQRNDVEQQPVVLLRAVAGQHVGLHRGAKRNHLVRVEVGQRLLAEEGGDRALDLGHARRAADHHHALDLFGRQSGIAQRFAHRRQGLLYQVAGHVGELVAGDDDVDQLARAQAQVDGRLFAGREQFLHFARFHLQPAGVFQRRRIDVGAFEDGAEQPVVEIVATQRRIAIRRQHFENAARQLENRQVEGAAAKVVHRVDPFGCVVQAIGHRSRRRLVEQAQHIQAGQACCILGRLPLGIVEIGRHRDDHADQPAAQAGFGAYAQHTQNFGRNLDRAFHALHGTQPHHARAVLEIVGHGLDMGHVLEAAPHETLCRHDGVAWIGGLRLERAQPGLGAAVYVIAHHRGQHRAAGLVRQAHGDPVAHAGNERVGGPQVDAHREPVLVRFGGHAGFGNLQQGHRGIGAYCCFQPSSASRASSISCWSFSMNISRRTVSAAPARS
ncbi:NAD-specific glutamate dehydrogenase [Thauera linaloolentis 47Lol = DSM 12138]|uniref:NAD-specific glutamate dehydrogenase n=1 Tax=Thauera linaloolentis (strain DSM 12138 / JCM 21573 / CCUG 41526 / CIP 105981 / IAM 15112 / NBRC 102519 / 47Lol) TaxID=1123367 RepID=N6Y7K9_THAL4|nr:NAD-specific glutamate dehydrogenase [Thauera linaloolentis 47Lol = DSM 12138]